MNRRVVVTAADIITSNAESYDQFSASLLAGHAHATPITRFEVSCLNGQKAFQIQSLGERNDLDLLISLIERQRSNLPSKLSRTDVINATTMGAGPQGQYLIDNSYRDHPQTFQYHEVMDCTSGRLAEQLQRYFNATGGALTICDACSSGTSAIGQGRLRIQAKLSDSVLVVGANLLFEMPFYGFNALRLISPTVCAPFDKNRNGLLLGEGAGMLLMESLESATARSANILAELIGYGASSDAYHITAPDPSGEGPARAMTQALSDAGLHPDAIDYINAHGTGTRQNDAAECRAIQKVFALPPPVSSTKSMIGHTLGAAGILEAIACLTALKGQYLPPTINATEQDPQCPLDIVPNKAKSASLEYVMSNSFGFGGNNAVIILKRWRP